MRAPHGNQSGGFQEVFSDIYKCNVWLRGSGEGSLPSNTGEYRDFLQHFLRSRAIRSVVDAGCGDWQFSSMIDWSGIEYTGIDIVEDVIKRNRSIHAAPGRTFLHADIAHSGLPAADLLLLKDVLQHWPNDSILSFLPTLESFRYALITNDSGPGMNADIRIGEYRALDLTQPPFSLAVRDVFAFPWYSEHHRLWFVKKVFLYESARVAPALVREEKCALQ